MMKLTFDPTRPIYLQIMEWLKQRAARGDLRPGDQVPSVRELAHELQVNPNTVARAYRELEREGFLFTLRGQGTFVTRDPERISRERQQLFQRALEGFLQALQELHPSPKEVARLLEDLQRALRTAASSAPEKTTPEKEASE